MLSTLVLCPLLGVGVVLCNSNSSANLLGLCFSFVSLLISLVVWAVSHPDVQWIESLFNFQLVVDGLSIPFILLTTFIFPFALLSNWSNLDFKRFSSKYFVVLMLLVEFFLLLVFTVSDLILFYIFFESILPPLFILIGLYGSIQRI